MTRWLFLAMWEMMAHFLCGGVRVIALLCADFTQPPLHIYAGFIIDVLGARAWKTCLVVPIFKLRKDIHLNTGSELQESVKQMNKRPPDFSKGTALNFSDRKHWEFVNERTAKWYWDYNWASTARMGCARNSLPVSRLTWHLGCSRAITLTMFEAGLWTEFFC